MREGQVASPPSDARSSAGVTTDGTLDVRRISFVGTWQGAGARRTLTTFNRPLSRQRDRALHRRRGARPPLRCRGATAAILFPFPAAIPNADLAAPVVEVRTGGAPVPIPLGGAVLVATGSAAAALAAEAPGRAARDVAPPLQAGLARCRLRDRRRPSDRSQRRCRLPCRRARSRRASSGRGRRAARIGQLADGRIILVAVDGRQPGYSVGMTNFELAQTLVRLGAVTGMALDSGGSTTMAFDGTLLNRPSQPERPISTALLFQYTGVFVAAGGVGRLARRRRRRATARACATSSCARRR